MKRALLLALSVCLFGSAEAAAQAAGDAARGQAHFAGDGRCLSCHMVDGRGSSTAHELTWIGLLRTEESLRQSLAEPVHSPVVSSAQTVDVVAYLRTLRKIWAVDPGDRTRDIAPASGNVEFFNRPDRDAEERPDEILRALKIPVGSTVADVGAGTGYYTWRLATLVGPRGKVFAVDVQPSMLEEARATVKRHGLGNVEFVLAQDDNPRLAEKSLDVAFIAYAYHEFADPESVMTSIGRALKPGGRVVILEFAKESTIAPASNLHKMSFEEIRREIEPLGFAIDQLLDFLPVQHGVVFVRKP
jgi:SAM-dependent methyltransferase